ncbi:uncharacterized protein L3040_007729 [Drepanopeziza brunnea f. sp. 'multigermtubi']|uniref:uncharacterized protein n=1 Tax=Drepanopeziza brunnea f. sp. 'multigermtubi' TaxID=698441 RepID=UPI0023968B12|nr:hypothetical protein L3040_007729 [Drepanopeziza brunnea f. sp. 'multigermtubi']
MPVAQAELRHRASKSRPRCVSCLCDDRVPYPHTYFREASISNLSIRGVRSFDNQDKMSLKFQTPLTLIVGINGSGKTTIIECLKYATTGELPPNTKNGAFVHDPKLIGEKEVLAQVKLGFRNGVQSEYVVSRSMSLTVQKTTQKFKTLESNLMMKSKRSGERISISSTVADCNAIVPQQLGVSSAILENVIFCHQDESLWPMLEPSKLKLKFDEIFEAQKYTKAIENIIKVKKGHQENLGKLKIHESNFKELKDMSVKIEHKMHRLQEEIDALTEKRSALDREIADAEKVSREKRGLLETAQGVKYSLAQKRGQAENYEYTLESLSDNLTELQESDEWLRDTLGQYEQRMADYQTSRVELMEKHNHLGRDVKKNREQISAKEIEQGQRQSQQETYERQLIQRVNYIQEAAQEHSIRGYDGDLGEDAIRQFVGKLHKLSKDKDRELAGARKTTSEELKQTQGVLSQLENRQATLKQEKVHAGQAITDNERRIRLKQSEMNSISIDEGAKAVLESKINELQEMLDKATSKAEAAGWDQKLKAEKSRLQQLEEQLEKLNDELFQSNKLAKDRAALDYAKQQAKESRSSLNAMISTYKDQLTEAIGNWTPQNLATEYESVLQQRKSAVDDAKANQDNAIQRLNEIGFELKTARSSLAKKNNELQKNQAKLFTSILEVEGEDPVEITTLDQYLQEYQELEADLAKCRSLSTGAGSLKQMYDKFIETIDQKNCCRLCEREFANQTQRAHASTKLKKMIADLDKEVLKEELEANEKAFKVAEPARPLYDVCKKLQDIEIPALNNDIKRLEGEKATRVATCERHDRLVYDEESAKRDMEGFAKAVSDITKYNNEIFKHENEITKLSSQDMLSGSSLTIDDLGEQIAACNEKIRALKPKIEKLVNDKENSRNEIIDLERRLGAATTELDRAQNALEKKQDIISAIDEFREYINQQKATVSKADAELESLEPDFAKARRQHEDVKLRGDTKANEIQAAKDKVASTVNKFKIVEDEINGYIENGGPDKLKACTREIKRLKDEQETIEKEIAAIVQEINKLKDRIADSDKTKKDIQDNIRYRKARRELEAVRTEIAELETHNADEEYEMYLREYNRSEKRRELKTAERGPITGTITAKDEDLGKTMEDYETDYKSAAEDYRKAHIEVETTKAAIDDMVKCTKALDSAILQFHSVKMEEINSIAGELWRATYQGTDVDTIMVRSDNENVSTTTTRRNFNYRVVMVKQDAEMDMRGRCSAGQKVLACIIIRLALAECFGVNCGVIALDEPTTNLDEDNIRALAGSLHKIIEQRRHQPNFQLIIITHDEEFLKEMKCNDFTDSYYRVSRNAAQKSVIEVQSLADMME